MRNLFEIDAWRIIEQKFDPSKQKQAESIFSIGNGAFGHEPILRKTIAEIPFREAMLEVYITQIRQE